MPQPQPSPTHFILVYHFCRLRLPTLVVPANRFQVHLERAFELNHHRRSRKGAPPTWSDFLESLHSLDFFLVCACLEGQDLAWNLLPTCRTSRRDILLVDALRSRALRLFPRNPEYQEEAVQEFWGFLLTGPRDNTVPTLARYDGQAPLVPWLLQVFKNLHLSRLRQQPNVLSLSELVDPGDVGGFDLPSPELTTSLRYHEEFRSAARDWLAQLSEQEILLVGLLWRYRLSQREVARVIGIHEGNITRKLDKLATNYRSSILTSLQSLGCSDEEDLSTLIQTEMPAVLLEEPRLAADRLAALLAARGKSPPALPSESSDPSEPEETGANG